MAVQARFWVQSVKRQTVSGGNLAREVVLAPVVRPGGADGNVDWSKYTPSGEIKMTVTADAAGEWFEQMQLAGRDVAITFSDPDE